MLREVHTKNVMQVMNFKEEILDEFVLIDVNEKFPFLEAKSLGDVMFPKMKKAADDGGYYVKSEIIKTEGKTIIQVLECFRSSLRVRFVTTITQVV